MCVCVIMCEPCQGYFYKCRFKVKKKKNIIKIEKFPWVIKSHTLFMFKKIVHLRVFRIKNFMNPDIFIVHMYT